MSGRVGAGRGPWLFWLTGTAAVGVLLGVAWWLGAPGGAFYGDGADFGSWLPRDLVFAGGAALAGLVTAIVLLWPGSRPAGAPVPVAAFLAAMGGALLGSVIAWRVGLLAAALFADAPPDPANPSVLFSLRSGSVLLLWPLVGAVGVLLSSLFTRLRGPAPYDA